jgi:hypothetical protein
VTVDRRFVGTLALLLDVSGALVLGAAPNDVGAIRLGGVSLMWWYGAVAGPALAASVAAVILTSPTRG